MILIMRTALRASVPANRVGRFRIMVSSGVALNSEMHAGERCARIQEKTVAGNRPFHIRNRAIDHHRPADVHFSRIMKTIFTTKERNSERGRIHESLLLYPFASK